MAPLVVRVFDEVRRTAKDFSCDEAVLFAGVPYLKGVSAHGSKQGNSRPSEISVHCDIEVFSSLLGYAQGSFGRGDITAERATQLLIASNFLQMEPLVSDCLSVMGERLVEVVAALKQEGQAQAGQPGGDLTALPLELLARLAKAVLERLAAVEDACGHRRHAALAHRLYKYKLEGCLRDLRTTLARCSACQGLFSLADRAKLECPGAPPHSLPQPQAVPGGRGGAGPAVRNGVQPARRPAGSTTLHIPDASWRLQEYLARLRSQRIGWRPIYWHVWGLAHVLYCHACLQHAPAAQLRACTFHPRPPVFSSSAHAPKPGAEAGSSGGGFFPCCGAAAARGADPRVMSASGCCSREHRLLPSGHSGGGGGGAAAAALPAGLTPALLATLASCAHLFTRPEELMVPEPPELDAGGGGAVAAAAVAGGDRRPSSPPGGGGGGDRPIPPAIQAVLDAAAAAAASAAAVLRRRNGGGGGSLGLTAGAAAAAPGYGPEPPAARPPPLSPRAALPPPPPLLPLRGASSAPAATFAAAVELPPPLTGDTRVDARVLAAAVARRLAGASSGGGGGGGGGGSGSDGVASPSRLRPVLGHARSHTSLAALAQVAAEQQEGEEEEGWEEEDEEEGEEEGRRLHPQHHDRNHHNHHNHRNHLQEEANRHNGRGHSHIRPLTAGAQGALQPTRPAGLGCGSSGGGSDGSSGRPSTAGGLLPTAGGGSGDVQLRQQLAQQQLVQQQQLQQLQQLRHASQRPAGGGGGGGGVGGGAFDPAALAQEMAALARRLAASEIGAAAANRPPPPLPYSGDEDAAAAGAVLGSGNGGGGGVLLPYGGGGRGRSGLGVTARTAPAAAGPRRWAAGAGRGGDPDRRDGGSGEAADGYPTAAAGRHVPLGKVVHLGGVEASRGGGGARRFELRAASAPRVRRVV
ncbi:hypothetical protein TSOC_008039 [Tetrabaena socialis]|uniref:SANT and BTB domain-containing protein n=1 Tax=Tetrabaena socialis TaxID=47790 RepID=A0A2J7ZZH9_9CHLO|nr:hypothetical protein TSOC_008039 [Tetrabaena socialis]|eukprot:PNH05687.1 hypothetical protein TSOC_008039 [Tetrabaena socialis]